jgi:hypothetical protein
VPRVIIAFFISGFFEFEVSHDLALYCWRRCRSGMPLVSSSSSAMV